MSNDDVDTFEGIGSVAKAKKDDSVVNKGEGNNATSITEPTKSTKSGWDALLALDKAVQARRSIGIYKSKWPSNVGNKKDFKQPPRTAFLLSTPMT